MTTFDDTTGLAQDSFGIGTFSKTEGNAFPGLVRPDGTVFDLSGDYTDTHAIFDDWDRGFDRLEKRARDGGGQGLRFEDLRILPPLPRPNMHCAGSNYRQHVAEMMTHNKFNQHKRHSGESDESFFQRNLEEVDRRAREGMPFTWTGLHSSLTGAYDDVILPLVGEQHDWELELGVVTCGTGRYLTPDETDKLVAGYVIVNDLGSVDQATRSDTRFEFDWISKHQPTFKPFGPFIVPKQFVDRSKIRIHLEVNGKTMQDWPVTDMIFQPEQILSYLTERIRLMPGDLLLTGSPPGNGALMGKFLEPGDVIDSELTYLGRQHNRVVAEETGGRKPTYGKFITDW